MAVIGSSMKVVEDACNLGDETMRHHRFYGGKVCVDALDRRPAKKALFNVQTQQWVVLEDPYAGTRFAQGPTTADKLNAWYARLEERVAQIEADDAVMGKKETKRWMDELAAFKADLS